MGLFAGFIIFSIYFMDELRGQNNKLKSSIKQRIKSIKSLEEEIADINKKQVKNNKKALILKSENNKLKNSLTNELIKNNREYEKIRTNLVGLNDDGHVSFLSEWLSKEGNLQ